MKKIVCKFCGKEFLNPISKKFCSSSCRNKNHYYSRTYTFECVYCGNTFVGRKNEKLCENCKGTRIVKETKEKPLYCPVCKENIVGYRTVVTLHNCRIYSLGMCPSCKVKSREKIVARMKSDKNPQIVKYGRKVVRDKEEVKAETVKRMKLNNPMKNPDVVKKMLETRKNRVYNIKRGTEHAGWKGNRDRGQTIRFRLYRIWILKELEKSNWVCDLCKSGGRLEVHHIDPTIREMIDHYLPDNRRLDELSDEEFDRLSCKIEQDHVDGKVRSITLCVECHKFVDDLRR